jgi:uncharacterized delta-60 repeat protein
MKINIQILAFAVLLFANNTKALSQTAGALDESFGDNGTVITQFGGGYDRSAGLVVQPDQQIVISGSARIVNSYDVTLVRFNTDGTYDNSFGNNGIAYSDTFGNYSNQSRPLAIQPDGKLIHVCVTAEYTEYNFLISRFNSDGALDTDFNGTGTVEQSVFDGDDYANSVALQPDGKILVVGMGTTGISFFNMVAMRLNPDGSLDSSFNNDGIFTTYLGDHDNYIFDVSVLPNGKILLLGQSYITGTANDPVLIRLNADGSYDTSFGDDGIATFIVSNGFDFVTQFVLQPDGKVLVVGNTAVGNFYDVFILRVDDTGALDNTFGIGGLVTTHVSNNKNWAESITLADDGKILVGGYYTNESTLDNDGMVLRFTPDGSPDPTFGDNGVATIDAYFYYIENISVQADHKILVSGWYNTAGVDMEFAVSRLHSDGNIGIENTISDAPLEIFPNPSDGKFSLHLPHYKTGKNEISVSDVSGRIVFQTTNHKMEALDLRLPAGIYNLCCDNGSEVFCEKLVIIN